MGPGQARTNVKAATIQSDLMLRLSKERPKNASSIEDPAELINTSSECIFKPTTPKVKCGKRKSG